MSESNFRTALKDKLPDFAFVHVESSIGSGIPDTQFTEKETKLGGWIELKYEKGDAKKVKLRKEQVVWNRRYNRSGGRSYVALKVGSNFIYLWHGKYARELYHGKDWNIDIYKELPCRCFNLRDGGWQKFSDFLKEDMKDEKPILV